jgi:hypothetical protein
MYFTASLETRLNPDTRGIVRDGQSGPGGTGTKFIFLTRTGTKFSFSPEPGPGRNFFSHRDRDRDEINFFLAETGTKNDWSRSCLGIGDIGFPGKP